MRKHNLTNKKTVTNTKTFREYLQRVNLETLTFYRDKDIWNTLQCFLNTFAIFLIRPSIQIYIRCTVAESILKTSCYWKVLLKIYFMFNLFPFPSPHLLLLGKEPPPVTASTSFSIEDCFGNYPEILSPGEPERGFGRKSKDFWMAIYFSRWHYIFLDGNIFFQVTIYFS